MPIILEGWLAQGQCGSPVIFTEEPYCSNGRWHTRHKHPETGEPIEYDGAYIGDIPSLASRQESFKIKITIEYASN